jgi:hypothetical protein
MLKLLTCSLLFVLLFTANTICVPYTNVSADPIDVSGSGIKGKDRKLKLAPNAAIKDLVWNNGKKELHCHHTCVYQGKNTKRVLELEVSKVTSAGISQNLLESVVRSVCPSKYSQLCSCASIYNAAAANLAGQNIQWIMTWMNDACVASSAVPKPDNASKQPENSKPADKVNTGITGNKGRTGGNNGKGWFSRSRRSLRRPLRRPSRRPFVKRRNVLKVPTQKFHKRQVFRAGKKTKHSKVRSWIKQSRKSSKAVRLPPKHKYNTLELAELPQNVLVENELDFDQEFGF